MPSNLISRIAEAAAATGLVPSAAGFISPAGPMAEASAAAVGDVGAAAMVGPVAAAGSDASAPAPIGGGGRHIMAEYSAGEAAMRRRLKAAPKALRRFDDLLAASKLATMAARAFDDDIRETEKQADIAKLNLDGAEGKTGMKVSPDSVARARAELDDAKNLLSTIKARREPLIERQRALTRTRQAVSNYLIYDAANLADAEPVKVAKSATIPGLEAKVADLRLDLEAVLAAPYPASEVKERIAAELDAIAEHGRVSVLHAVESGDQLQWPARDFLVTGFGAERNQYDRQSLAPATCLAIWLHRDALQKRLCADVDALAKAGEKAALSATERRTQAETIKANILSTERQVAEVVWAGGDLARFPEGLDPRAVIGVDGPPVREA